MLMPAGTVQISVFSYVEDNILPQGCISTLLCEGVHTKMRFISGIGKIVASNVDDCDSIDGRDVVFCGYSDTEISPIIITGINNIHVLQRQMKEKYSYCGIVARLINALNSMNVQVGMKAAFVSQQCVSRIITIILEMIGCSIVDSVSDADIGILYDPQEEILQKHLGNATIAVIGNTFNIELHKEQSILLFQEPGVLSSDSRYCLGNTPIPSAYIYNSVPQNLQRAVYFIDHINSDCLFEIGITCNTLAKIKNGDTDFVPQVDDYASTEQMRMIYSNHICAGVINASFWGSISSDTQSYVEQIVMSIASSPVTNKKVLASKRSEIIMLSFENGTIASCTMYNSKELKIRISVHFDQNTVVYQNDEIVIYQGDGKPTNEKTSPFQLVKQ